MKRKLGKKVLAGKMTVDEARAKMGRKVTQKAQEQLADLVEKGVLSVDEARAKLGMGPWQEPIAKGAEPQLLKSETVTLTQAPAIDPGLIKSAIAEAITPLTEIVTLQKSRLDEQQKMLDAIADQPDPKTASWAGLALKSRQPVAVAKQAEIAERTQQMINRQLTHVWRTSENPFEREAARTELDKRGFTE